MKTLKLSGSQRVTSWKALIENYQDAGVETPERELVDALEQATKLVVLYQELMRAADWWNRDRVVAAMKRFEAAS